MELFQPYVTKIFALVLFNYDYHVRGLLLRVDLEVDRRLRRRFL